MNKSQIKQLKWPKESRRIDFKWDRARILPIRTIMIACKNKVISRLMDEEDKKVIYAFIKKVVKQKYLPKTANEGDMRKVTYKETTNSFTYHNNEWIPTVYLVDGSSYIGSVLYKNLTTSDLESHLGEVDRNL